MFIQNEVIAEMYHRYKPRKCSTIALVELDRLDIGHICLERLERCNLP